MGGGGGVGVHVVGDVSLTVCSGVSTEGTEPWTESCSPRAVGPRPCRQLHLELEGSRASCECSLEVHAVNLARMLNLAGVRCRSFLAQLRPKEVTALPLQSLVSVPPPHCEDVALTGVSPLFRASARAGPGQVQLR